MGRESHQKRSKADKAKLDSKGRPLATQAPKAPEEPERDKLRTDQVRVAVRLGIFAFALSTQTGCEPDAQPTAVDPRVETAIAETKLVIEDARAAIALTTEMSSLALDAATKAQAAADLCKEAAK